MRIHFKEIIKAHSPDILFLSETKLRRVVRLYYELGDE